MREFTKDDAFEYLIRRQVDGPAEAMKAIVSREPTEDDFKAMDRLIGLMYNGWVRMNGNARRLFHPEPK